MDTLRVTTDFSVNGTPAGKNVASLFQPVNEEVYELKLKQPITSPGERTISVSIKDNQGNTTRIDRTFSVE